jgi:hypothetical protein
MSKDNLSTPAMKDFLITGVQNCCWELYSVCVAQKKVTICSTDEGKHIFDEGKYSTDEGKHITDGR